ncbi:MAG: NAD(P)-dependent oxidoreductase [Faecousia sp.]
MKVGVYRGVLGGAERFRPIAQRKYGNQLEFLEFDCLPKPENFHLAREQGCQALIYFSDRQEDAAYFRALAENGICYMCCCSAGYDCFNLEAMTQAGIRAANVPTYSPSAIAEHAVLLTLSVLRHYRQQLLRVEARDFRLEGLMARELRQMNVGVVGTGRIGSETVQCLAGFRPRGLYAYSPHPNKALGTVAQYVSVEELFRRCDVILFHCAYREQTHHMVNTQTLARMKDGVILINTARGGLFDTQAVLEGVRSGKIGGLGLDVIEGEGAFTGAETAGDRTIPALEELLSFPNVVFTRHTAFYTDAADRNIVETTVDNLHQYASTGVCDNELTGLVE